MAKLTPDAITQAAEVKPIDLWEPPTPFDEDQLLPFPVEVLPSWLAQYVFALAHATQTPPDLAGLLVLAALATAMAKKVRVTVRQGYSESVNIFALIGLNLGSLLRGARETECGVTSGRRLPSVCEGRAR